MDNNVFDIAQSILKAIPCFHNVQSIEMIQNVDSGEPKFCVRDQDGSPYLLRLSGRRHYDQARQIFNQLLQARQSGASVPEPIEQGLCQDNSYSYLLTRWIQGLDCSEVILSMAPPRQYETGVEAGIQLKRLHSLNCLSGSEQDWQSRQLERWQDLRPALLSPVRTSTCGRKFVQFVDQNLSCMADRPLTVLHGDVRLSNMILTDGSLSLIDFGQLAHGDPLFDLAGALCELPESCQYFATGLLDCYFIFNPSEKDLKLLSLYSVIHLAERYVKSGYKSELLDGLWVCETKDLETAKPCCYKRLKHRKGKDIWSDHF